MDLDSILRWKKIKFAILNAFITNNFGFMRQARQLNKITSTITRNFKCSIMILMYFSVDDHIYEITLNAIKNERIYINK